MAAACLETPVNSIQNCGVCGLHSDSDARQRYEISRSPLWILRHHPDPAPLPGWLLLDARRHLAGAIAFTTEEAAAWGGAVQQASQLVQALTRCDRVYAIAFGEGARHLHLHLIPRCGSEPATEAWRVADLYRAVARGAHPPADPETVRALVERARQALLTSSL
ncbi:MAG: diadenosine tetraphosphate hydrolase [Cyanobacteria bacterium K_DeepCast_35m_m1_288]|nr:diadenosine tetraphosphate hydrolase [Cyanobacteria bacterium K_DeepCast_35m_m1_288]